MINYWSKEVITLLIYWFVVWLVGWLVGWLACLLVKKKSVVYQVRNRTVFCEGTKSLDFYPTFFSS